MGIVGEYSSLALDENDYPHISYYDCTDRNLRYAWKDVSGWHLRTVDDGSKTGTFTSICLDFNGYPHIVYLDYYAGGNPWTQVKYAFQDAVGWHSSTVVPWEGHTLSHTSLALDSTGYPHLVFYDDGSAYDLEYAWRDTAGWHFATIDGCCGGNMIGGYCSLALDANDFPHISYINDSLHSLKCATRLASPSLEWVFTTRGSVGSSPAVGRSGTIYVGSDDGYLYAVNPGGTERWRFNTEGRIMSSPAIASDGTIYFGSEDQKFYAVNPDGTEKWSFATGGRIRSSPAIASDGTIYVGSRDENLYAINPDGTEKWHFGVGYDIHESTPVIGGDGTIYMPSYVGDLCAVNSDGSEKWRFLTGGGTTFSAVIATDGTLYLATTDKSLYAINPDGTEKWRLTFYDPIYKSPTLSADGNLYLSVGTNLYAITPEGHQLWAQPGLDLNSGLPAVGANGYLYGGKDCYLFAVSPEGTEEWRLPTLGSVFSSPAITDTGILYIGSSDGNLYAMTTGSGGLVDSQWPMFQHDLQHTGNAGSSNNLPPIADAGPDQTVTDTDGDGQEDIALDGSESEDPDGDIVSWVWTGNGTELATGEEPTLLLSVGVHTITLTVTDNDGDTNSDTVVITVQAAANQPPVANAGPDQTVADTDGNGHETVTLDGSESDDPDGNIVSWVWTENGTEVATSEKPTVSLSVGVHTITLTITDNGGDTDSDTVVITVQETTDTTPPALIQDFSASDGDNEQSTLRWTNPPDSDLAEVVVRRKTTGYPENHLDGDLRFQNTSPTSGNQVEYVDQFLVNGATYYYAVFSCDSAGNWNASVVSGGNTDIGAPYTGIQLVVPYYDQGQTDWCWATSAAMMLKYYHSIDSRCGTPTPGMIAASFNKPPEGNSAGLRWDEVNDLKYYLELVSGFPWVADDHEISNNDLRLDVINAIDLWRAPVLLYDPWGIHHAIVITGYSGAGDSDYVYFHDPSGLEELTRGQLYQRMLWMEFFEAIGGQAAALARAILYAPKPVQNGTSILPLTVSILTNDFGIAYGSPDAFLFFLWEGSEPYSGYRYEQAGKPMFPDDPEFGRAFVPGSVVRDLTLSVANAGSEDRDVKFDVTIHRTTGGTSTPIYAHEIEVTWIVSAHSVEKIDLRAAESLLPLLELQPGTYRLGISVLDAATDTPNDICEIDFRVAAPALAGTNVQVDFPNGRGSLTFDTVTEFGHANIVELDASAQATINIKVLDTFYSIDTTASFSGGVTIILDYDDAGLTTSQERDLRMYRVSGSPWWMFWETKEDITISVDTDANVITGRADGFSSFLIGREIGTIPEEQSIIHGPNPVPAEGCIFWLDLPDEAVSATLKIFDIDGSLLVSIPLDATDDRYPGAGRWIPEDDQGRLLGTGLYIYLVESEHTDGTTTYSSPQKMVVQR